MIGDQIVKIRKERGYTLSELADLANISKSYLSNIERNMNKNPSLEIMNRIAAVLNVEITTLVKSDPEAHKYIEKEWVEFIRELKELGLEKHQMKHYKTLIEFIKWQNEREEKTGGKYGKFNQFN